MKSILFKPKLSFQPIHPLDDEAGYANCSLRGDCDRIDLFEDEGQVGSFWQALERDLNGDDRLVFEDF